ncbi:penicillin-binding protein 2 [Paenarthrobacter sp. DKR-5]|uniref:peptidoglycan D,D-transpeptidase FtsI family protein n=1 Tax=Paenarthrobacter sp. DKR-5 TaxID=2835535 RepID=UPI001BDC47D5|nr:penicillin-binding protein 2 [Paenarthrobacter sp. DKR-5]MBT1002156.1 penicillin-binding protein 2 [Paenarthrobacter sp. DKR-5]
MARNSSKSTAGSQAAGATRRLRAGIGIVLVLLLVIGGRLFLVQGLDFGGMAEAAVKQRTQVQTLAAARGEIIDSKGNVLARSVIRYDIVVDQTQNAIGEFDRKNAATGKLDTISRDQGIAELAAALGKSDEDVRTAVTGSRTFNYVARTVTPDVNDAVTKLAIPGIYSRPTTQRVYPFGAVAGGVVGFLGADGTPLAGLEQTMDSKLQGKDGQRSFQIGADGARIPYAPAQETPAQDGQSVKLSIDSDIQWYAQQAIQSQVDKVHAEWGNVVVVEVKTGRIIAMADSNAPDPNKPGATAAKDRGVRSVTAAYEPGSTEKMITAASLIQTGKATALEHVVVPPTYTINGQTFTDAFDHGYENRTLAGIVGFSMNTGTVMLGSRLTKQQRYDWLRRFGIGQRTGIELPGEGSGILATPDKWDGRQEYTVLFGQGVAQTTLQTAMAYQAIANNGVRLKPRLVDAYVDPDGTEHPVPTAPGTEVVSPKTAQSVKDILESTVTDGEVKEAKIDGYRVGAKTGTAESPADNGGGFDGYTASLVGMAPMDNPKYVVVAVVQRPQGSIYGITNGPVFTSVMSQVLRANNVAPSTGKPPHLPQFFDK